MLSLDVLVLDSEMLYHTHVFLLCWHMFLWPFDGHRVCICVCPFLSLIWMAHLRYCFKLGVTLVWLPRFPIVFLPATLSLVGEAILPRFVASAFSSFDSMESSLFGYAGSTLCWAAVDSGAAKPSRVYYVTSNDDHRNKVL